MSASVKSSSFAWLGKKFLIPLLASATLIAGCGGSDDGGRIIDVQVDECSTIGQNQFVYDVMQDIYFWNTSIPNLNPDGFSSPEALLDEMISNSPVLDRFSFIGSQAAEESLFNEGLFVGLGFSSTIVNNDSLFLRFVYPNSPAEEAGLRRGDNIITIDGVNVAATLAAGNTPDFGASAAGTNVEIEYINDAGVTQTVVVTKRETSVPTVSANRVIDNAGVPTAYMHFLIFIQPSESALDAAFADFRAQGAQELIVDLRYNGGGIVPVAEYMAGLLGGSTTNGQVFFDRVHNSQNANLDETSFFENQANSLGIDKVVFITNRNSASASELVINGLSPFMDVTIVGDTTFGKPVGQFGFNFCGKVLRPTSFQTVNALGEGDYFDGLPADCPAPDDLTAQLGDEAEASLATALGFLRTGSCTPTASTKTITSFANTQKSTVKSQEGFE